MAAKPSKAEDTSPKNFHLQKVHCESGTAPRKEVFCDVSSVVSQKQQTWLYSERGEQKLSHSDWKSHPQQSRMFLYACPIIKVYYRQPQIFPLSTFIKGSFYFNRHAFYHFVFVCI